MKFALYATCFLLATLMAGGALKVGIAQEADDADPIDIGQRRCMFVDDYLIDTLSPGARLMLHQPVPREVAIEHRSSLSAYHTVFKDGDLYRMYYRGGGYSIQYAESDDGIEWREKDLAFHDVEEGHPRGSHGFTAFKDDNPDCEPEARYKAVTSGSYRYRSPDGINWYPMEPFRAKQRIDGDSQTVTFWDSNRECYVSYARSTHEGKRWIYTAKSDDFLTWNKLGRIDIPDAPVEHLYTNQVTQYYRAPHVYMGFPKRYINSRWMEGSNSGVSDGLFMTSRDGITFKRWREAFIRPGLQSERWASRNNMTACGIVETASAIAGAPNELSIYSSEGYYHPIPTRLRRYTVRLDGFVSVNAPAAGGELLTKPLVFDTPDDEVIEGAPDEDGQNEYNAYIDDEAPLRGESSLVLQRYRYPVIPMEMMGTASLGKNITMAVDLKGQETGYRCWRRIFESSKGDHEKAGSKELLLETDLNRDNTGMLRFVYDGFVIEAPMEARDGRAYHLTVTWDDGIIKIYVDGEKIAEAEHEEGGDFELSAGNLQFASLLPAFEPHGTSEPFLGKADDIMAINRTLSDDEIAHLFQDGAEAVVDADIDEGVLWTFEGDDKIATDRLPLPSRSDLRLTREDGQAQLFLNMSTSAAGGIKVELQDESGEPISGYELENCDLIYGDAIEQSVSWRGRTELKELAGRPIRIRLYLEDADVYSFRIGGSNAE